MRTRRRILPALLVLAFLTRATAQDEDARLAPGFKQGDVYVTESSVRLDLSFVVKNDRGEAESLFPVVIERKRSHETRVLSADHGEVKKLSRRYTTNSETRTGAALSGGWAHENTGVLGTFEAAIEGPMVDVNTIAPESKTDAPAPDEIKSDLEAFLRFSASRAFPGNSIKVGQSWTGEGRALLALLRPAGLAGANTAGGQFHFKGYTLDQGRRCARIDITDLVVRSERDGDATGMVLKGKGHLLFDLTKGLVVELVLKGEATWSDPASDFTAQGTFDTNAKISFKE